MPRDDSEALSMYLTMAKNSPNSEAIIKTLSLVKHSVTYNQNLKNLTKAGQKELKKTLGFLLACDENDEEITKFKVEGLRIATMETLLRLMPTFCEVCKDEEPFVVFPGDVPRVTCIRCDKAACPRCYNGEDIEKDSICYICSTCKDLVSKQAGIDAIEDKFLKKKSISRKGEESNDDVNPESEDLEDDIEEINPTRVDEDLEDNANFARALLNRQESSTPSGPKAPEDTPPSKKGICKHYRKGCCRHGFSGRKKVEDTLQCEWEHPKICPKLFKHGFHPERGCKGKKAGCEDFHPFICGELLKGECKEANCQRGFHLRSLVKKPKKRDQIPVVETIPPVVEVRQEPQSQAQPQTVPIQYIGPPPSDWLQYS